MNTTKEEEIMEIYHGGTVGQWLEYMKKYANQQVLTALEEVKSKVIAVPEKWYMKESGEVGLTATQGAVPLSAIEQIEEKYR